MSSEALAVFDAVARDYDHLRHRIVPDFDRFYGTVAPILAFDFAPDDEFRVLDLGAGTGLLSALLSASFPRAHFVLADGAPQMLEVARERFAGEEFAGAGRFEFLPLDFERDALPPDFDAVVSALAIHHLAPEGLEPLFGRVKAALRPGGVFINADQALGASARLAQQFEAQWQRDGRAAGCSEAEIAQGIERRRVDRHAPLEFQLDALRRAGFAEVEFPYKRFLFAVTAGWKPAA